MEPCAREMEQEGCSVWAKGVGEGGRRSESMWAICSLRRDPEAEASPHPLGLAESSPRTVSAEASWGHGRVLQAAGPTALQ